MRESDPRRPEAMGPDLSAELGAGGLLSIEAILSVADPPTRGLDGSVGVFSGVLSDLLRGVWENGWTKGEDCWQEGDNVSERTHVEDVIKRLATSLCMFVWCISYCDFERVLASKVWVDHVTFATTIRVHD